MIKYCMYRSSKSRLGDLLNVSLDVIDKRAAEDEHFFDAGPIQRLQGVVNQRCVDQRDHSLGRCILEVELKRFLSAVLSCLAYRTRFQCKRRQIVVEIVRHEDRLDDLLFAYFRHGSIL